MTFATEKLKAGRRKFEVVELDLDACSLTYSIAPCRAKLGTVFDLRTAAYDGAPDDLDVSGQDSAPFGVTFSADGLHLYVAGTANSKVYAFTLTTAFDLSTASHDGVPDDLDVSGQDALPNDLAISADGLHLYVVGNTAPASVYQYDLSAPHDLGTAVYNSGNDLDISTEEPQPRGMTLSDDGFHLYISGTTASASVYAYTLGTAFDLSTANYDGAPDDLDVSGQDVSPQGVAISIDGLHLYVVGNVTNKVYAYTLGTAFDLGTAVYDGAAFDLDVSGQDSTQRGIAFSSTGTHLYIVGDDNNKVYGYTLASGPGKCFNTFATCQDTENFTLETKTFRFCSPIAGISRAYDAIPSIRGIDLRPTKLDPGRSVGKRAKATITFQDHSHHDRGIDKYALERPDGTAGTPVYTPADQGSFFGKLYARNPHYVGRIMRIMTGFLPWDHDEDPDNQASASEATVEANLLTRTYVIDQWNGPDASGKFTIIGKDLLKIAEDSRAECPIRNAGVLAANIPPGVQGAEYDGAADDLDPTAQDAAPTSMDVSSDGTKMFVVGNVNLKVYSYTLGTPFDLSTATYDGVGKDLDISGRDSVFFDIAIANGDTKLYIIGGNNRIIFAYTLSTPRDLATATYDAGDDLSVVSEDSSPRGVANSSDGLTLYVGGDTNGVIYAYTLLVAFDLGTATYDGGATDLSVASRTLVRSISLSADGDTLYVIESGVGISVYTLLTPFQMQTGVYQESGFILTAGEGSIHSGVAVADDDTKVYAMGGTIGKIFSYSLTGFGGIALSPAGIGDAEYAASGTLRIGDEIMAFTRSGDDITITNRPTEGTGTIFHSAGDVVQQCHRWTATRVDTILQELLEDFANVDPSFIPIADWNTEAASFLSTIIYSVLISEPVGVTALINELSEQSMVVLFWNELDQEVQLKALRSAATDLVVTDANSVAKTLKQIDVPKQRLTRVTIRYGRVNILERLDKPTNFRLSHVSVDAGAETAEEFGDIRHRIINSRWLSSGDSAIAELTADGILARYVDTPAVFQFSLDVKDATIWTGFIIEIQSRYRQDTFGAVGSQIAQVIEARELPNGNFAYKAISI